jgi:HEPN/RES N-terminal domain 1
LTQFLLYAKLKKKTEYIHHQNKEKVMGQYKNYLIECEANGYYPKESYICAECVVDDFLAEIVNKNLCSNKCNYCQSELGVKIAAEFNTIVECITHSIRNYYSPAQNIDLPRAEGEYILDDYDINEVLADFDPGWPTQFRDDICESIIGDNWVKAPQYKWYAVHRDASLSYDWQNFKNQVMYKIRYLFLSEPHDEDDFESEDSREHVFLFRRKKSRVD